MDARSLATDIDKLSTEFLTRLRDESKFDKHVFDNLIDKLDAYAEITRNHEKIDKCVVKCLLQSYLAFREYFELYHNRPFLYIKQPLLYVRITLADVKLNKLRRKIIENLWL